MERLKSSFRKFYGRYGDLIQQYEVSLARMLNDILTLEQLQWLANRSDLPSISLPWYRSWPSPKNEWFPWRICNGCCMPAGNAYHSGYLVPSPFWGACMCSDCWDQFPRLYIDWMTYEVDSNRIQVSMEHLRRMWHASRGRLPFRTPGSVPLLGTFLCSNCWYQFYRTFRIFSRFFTLNTSRFFFDFDWLSITLVSYIPDIVNFRFNNRPGM